MQCVWGRYRGTWRGCVIARIGCTSGRKTLLGKMVNPAAASNGVGVTGSQTGSETQQDDRSVTLCYCTLLYIKSCCNTSHFIELHKTSCYIVLLHYGGMLHCIRLQ